MSTAQQMPVSQPVVAGQPSPSAQSANSAQSMGSMQPMPNSNQTPGFAPDNTPNYLSERVIQHEILVPKRVVREEVIEKVLIVPETVVREEIVEELQTVKETIIEVAKVVYQQKIIEVPQVEYREKIKEVPEIIYETKIKREPVYDYQERFVDMIKYVDPEGNEIDPPEEQTKEIIIEKIVEIPEIQEQVTLRKIPIPKYIEKVIKPDAKTNFNIPVPVEAVTVYNYELQHPTAVTEEVNYPAYLPVFKEVPVAVEMFDDDEVAEMNATTQRLQMLAQQKCSLSQLEKLATDIRQQPFLTKEPSAEKFKATITNAWKSGQLQMIDKYETLPA